MLQVAVKIIIMRALPWARREDAQRLNYPSYGESGFDEPVGKKHYSSRLSAIHKLIFNDPSSLISRD